MTQMKPSKETLLLTIPFNNLEDIIIARQRARQIMIQLAYKGNEQTRMTTALSEIARNACQYAEGGVIRFSINPNLSYFTIYVTDQGKGIPNLSMILGEKFISKTGLGLGIPGARRLVDNFNISCSMQGTQVALSLELPLNVEITPKILSEIAEALVRHRPKEVSEELHQQNQELINAFDLLKKARDELEQRVMERTEELTCTNQVLQHEIDRRKETEQSLKEVSDRLLLTLESASVGTWHWSFETETLTWDKHTCLLFGIKESFFSGTLEDFLMFLVPEDRTRTREETYKMIEQQSNQAIEFRVLLTNKNIRYMMSRGRVNYDTFKKRLSMTGIYWDITDQVQIKEKTRIHREQMIEAARTSALGEMASSLAHEINQPLAAINVYTQGCIKRIESESFDVSEIHKILSIVVKQAQRAGQVIHRIRNFAKKGELLSETLELNALIQESIQIMQYEIEKFGVEIVYHPIVSMEVYVDKIQIQQVMLNLIRNAMECMQEIGTVNPQVIIQVLENQNDSVAVSVSDKGSGIPLEIIPKLFDPYFSTKVGGMGLGLAICRSIIEAHGSQLVAFNRPDGGSCFQFNLSRGT